MKIKINTFTIQWNKINVSISKGRSRGIKKNKTKERPKPSRENIKCYSFMSSNTGNLWQEPRAWFGFTPIALLVVVASMASLGLTLLSHCSFSLTIHVPSFSSFLGCPPHFWLHTHSFTCCPPPRAHCLASSTFF